MTSLLAIHELQHQVQPITLPNDGYVINLEEPSTNSTSSSNESSHNNYHQHHHHITTILNNSNMQETANEFEGQNNNNNNNSSENTIIDNNGQISPEARTLLKQLKQYVPFVTILFAKSLYDHRTRILMYVVLLITFIHANNDLKREITKQYNRNWSLLMWILGYITACIVFVSYTFDLHIFVPYAEPLTLWDLLCYVIVMDFFLKLITIICKVLLTCLPVRLLAFQNRVSIFDLSEIIRTRYNHRYQRKNIFRESIILWQKQRHNFIDVSLPFSPGCTICLRRTKVQRKL